MNTEKSITSALAVSVQCGGNPPVYPPMFELSYVKGHDVQAIVSSYDDNPLSNRGVEG